MDSKRAGPWIAIIVLVFIVAGEALALWSQNRIATIRAEVVAFEYMRDSVNAVVAVRDSMVRELEVAVASGERAADSLRGVIAAIDTVIIDNTVGIRVVSSFGAIVDSFGVQFPIVARRSIRTRYAPDPDFPDDSLNYYMIPTASLTSFVLDRKDLEDRTRQIVEYEGLDQQNKETISNQGQAIDLVQANQATLQQAFDTTSVLYRERSQQLIDEIGKPRFELGLGTGIAGGIVIGVLAAIAAGSGN